MLFADHLTLDAPKQLKDGYLAVRAKTARVGHYEYTGREVDPDNAHGLRDADTVHVLRDENTVFDEAAARSFIGKPITDDHPHTPVTAANWKDHARGVVMGALRDGDYLAFDLLLTDAALIGKVQDGKREISNGYEATLEFGDFTASDGTKCAARQASIAGNHCAIVARGRAGPSCAINDAATCEGIPRTLFDALVERTYSDGTDPHKTEPARRETSNSGGSHVATKTITFDGLPLEVTDAAEAAITKLQNQIKDEKARAEKAEGQVATLTTDKGKLEGEKAGLEKQLKDATDPAMLQAAATARATLINKAMSVSPNIVTDGKSDADIRKEVVNAKLGDDAKDFDDAKIEGAFLSLTKDAPAADPVRDALKGGVRTLVNDNGASVRDLARAAQF